MLERSNFEQKCMWSNQTNSFFSNFIDRIQIPSTNRVESMQSNNVYLYFGMSLSELYRWSAEGAVTDCSLILIFIDIEWFGLVWMNWMRLDEYACRRLAALCPSGRPARHRKRYVVVRLSCPTPLPAIRSISPEVGQNRRIDLTIQSPVGAEILVVDSACI
jgi:hypothetical protein